jgi:hypothetical protein
LSKNCPLIAFEVKILNHFCQVINRDNDNLIYFDFSTVIVKFDSQVYQHKIVNLLPIEQKYIISIAKIFGSSKTIISLFLVVSHSISCLWSDISTFSRTIKHYFTTIVQN